MKKGIVWSQKKMRAQKVKYSGVMGKIMGNKKVARALDQSKERKEFYGILKGVEKGGVSKDELRKISDKLAHGHDARTISRKEGRMIAEGLHEDFYADRKKYKFSRSSSSQNINPGTAKSTNNAATADRSSMTPVKMASIMNRIRTNSMDSSENDSEKKPKGSFSQAMAATMKNKRS